MAQKMIWVILDRGDEYAYGGDTEGEAWSRYFVDYFGFSPAPSELADFSGFMSACGYRCIKATLAWEGEELRVDIVGPRKAVD